MELFFLRLRFSFGVEHSSLSGCLAFFSDPAKFSDVIIMNFK